MAGGSQVLPPHTPGLRVKELSCPPGGQPLFRYASLTPYLLRCGQARGGSATGVVKESKGTPQHVNIYGYLYNIDTNELEMVVEDKGALKASVGV